MISTFSRSKVANGIARSCLQCSYKFAPKLQVTTPSIIRNKSDVLLKADPLFVQTYAGSRILELSRPEMHNSLTLDLLRTIRAQLQLYESNITIGAVFITSSDSAVFSSGINTNKIEDRSIREQLVREANAVSDQLARYKKPTIAVLDGVVDGTALSVFSGCKYRLGSSSTRFQIPDLLPFPQISAELCAQEAAMESIITGTTGPDVNIDDMVPAERNAYMPVGGGLAHFLASCGSHGVAIARYLAISGRSLTAHDMYVLGMLTHIVQERPHLTLADALAHTIAKNDYRKAVQTETIDDSALQQLLDTMHAYLPDKHEGITDANDASAAASIGMGTNTRATGEALDDIMSHPLWDRMLLVSPQPVPVESFFDSQDIRDTLPTSVADIVFDTEGNNDYTEFVAVSAGAGGDEDFEDIVDEVGKCFGPDDDAAAAYNRLAAIAASQHEQLQSAIEEAKAAAGKPRKEWGGEDKQPPRISIWAIEALHSWDSISSSALVQEWFKLTKQAGNSKLGTIYRAEEDLAHNIE